MFYHSVVEVRLTQSIVFFFYLFLHYIFYLILTSFTGCLIFTETLIQNVQHHEIQISLINIPSFHLEGYTILMLMGKKKSLIWRSRWLHKLDFVFVSRLTLHRRKIGLKSYSEYSTALNQWREQFHRYKTLKATSKILKAADYGKVKLLNHMNVSWWSRFRLLMKTAVSLML